MTRRTSADMMGNFSKPAASKPNSRPAPKQAVPVNRIDIPKGASADVREIDNGKVVRVSDGSYQTVKEVFVPDGQDVIIG